MKKIFYILLVVGLIAGYFYANQRGWVSANFQGDLGNQLAIITSRAQQLGGIAQNVFKTSVKIDDSGQSAQQKAFDYGQYLYCQQVVTTYEAKQ